MHMMSAFLMLTGDEKLAMQIDAATFLSSATNQSHDLLSVK